MAASQFLYTWHICEKELNFRLGNRAPRDGSGKGSTSISLWGLKRKERGTMVIWNWPEGTLGEHCSRFFWSPVPTLTALGMTNVCLRPKEAQPSDWKWEHPILLLCRVDVGAGVPESLAQPEVWGSVVLGSEYMFQNRRYYFMVLNFLFGSWKE